MTERAPETSTIVAALCLMCQEVLEVPPVSPQDDIFDLDPDSLTLQRLNLRIQQTWGVTVSLDVFYDTPSIGELALVIAHLRGES